MLVVNIHSGLGNQMMCYAAARVLSEKNNVPFAAYNEPSAVLNKSWQHKLSLNHFNVREFDLITEFSDLDKMGSWCCISCNHIGVGIPELPKDKNVFISELWLAEKSFEFFKKELKAELKVKTPPSQENIKMLKEIKGVNSVGVHIRTFSEYQGTTWLCEARLDNYYKRAVETIKGKVNNPVFYVFCLEMDWCKENFKIDGDVVYVDIGNPAYEEIRLMYSCKHFIAAGSTMSWWAEYLLENENGVKIAPVVKTAYNKIMFPFTEDGCILLPSDGTVTYEKL